MRIPVAGVDNTPRVPAPKPTSSVPTMPPAMQSAAKPKKTSAPTSGAVSNFKPTVTIPQPAVQAGQKGFVGPVATTVQSASKTANDYLNLGPLGGLASGVIAGVNAPLPGAGTSTGGTWTKAGTVETASGPVDVDANGIAQDGSTPVAKTKTTVDDGDDKTPTLVDTITDDYGNKIGIYSDGTKKTLVSSGRNYRLTVDEDAYAILTRTLEDNGIGDFAKIIQGYMDRGLGSQQAALEIRKEPIYQKRFAGNEARRKDGLNVLSEAEYLELENSYMKTLKAFGVPNELGKDKETRQTAMANLIAGDVDAIEFKDRVDTVVSRVKNADKTTKSTFNTFFGIKDEDLISYFLNPEANLPKLQEKVTAAEIGAAAKGQNLATSLDAATALAQFGVTKEQARTGYEAIGEVLPTATKLGQIYGDQYTQATAEQEVFQGTASAKRKRQQLAEREVATFSGSSGRMRSGRPVGNTGQF
jgi:hypothetical protein